MQGAAMGGKTWPAGGACVIQALGARVSGLDLAGSSWRDGTVVKILQEMTRCSEDSGATAGCNDQGLCQCKQGNSREDQVQERTGSKGEHLATSCIEVRGFKAQLHSLTPASC